MTKIPIYQPSLRGNERAYVDQCIESSWISSRGEFILRFEEAFARYTDVAHASSVSNGTVALHLALVALGIGPGDEVIVPSFTYVASVNAIAYTGATPVFVDSLESTWQMDPEDVARKTTPKTRAIMAVHLYGHPCEMESLSRHARDHGLFLVEDCAEAFGSLYRGRHVGSFGDVATYSFFGNKTITTGEGGMVVTNDDALHHRIARMKTQSVSEDREYWHDAIGFNYRMTNICAAIGLAQLERADEILAKKRQLAEWYEEGLVGAPVQVLEAVGDVQLSNWMCSIAVDDPAVREPLREAMASSGIETRPAFYPVHTMPMYLTEGEVHPIAANLSSRGINLPSWPELPEDQVTFICETIRSFTGA